MSTYAFDLDGTLDALAVAQLANDLFDAGHKILIVTGGLGDHGEWTVEERVKKLNRLGVSYTEIIRCLKPDIDQIGQEKGRVCAERGALLLFDDSDVYIAWSKSLVQCLKVVS